MLSRPGRKPGETQMERSCQEGTRRRPDLSGLRPRRMAGLVLYAFMKARRERLGESPSQVDNMPEESAVILRESA